jgi:hypothetical protein
VRWIADLRRTTFSPLVGWLLPETASTLSERELACGPGEGEIVTASTINCTMVMKLVIAATEIRKSPMIASCPNVPAFLDRRQDQPQ